jgi:antitoxin (DNA-binding transcriptional repressor) of toxin-antitoxin stability system
VIARNGKPAARLTSLDQKQKRVYALGLLEGQGWIADDFDDPLPDEILAQFEGR